MDDVDMNQAEDRKGLKTVLRALRTMEGSPIKGSFTLHLDGESDLEVTEIACPDGYSRLALVVKVKPIAEGFPPNPLVRTFFVGEVLDISIHGDPPWHQKSYLEDEDTLASLPLDEMGYGGMGVMLAAAHDYVSDEAMKLVGLMTGEEEATDGTEKA